MDEERFESLLLDELYGELDDETSAAVRRYAAAHPRAAEKLASLQAVRRAAAFPAAEPPEDLEDRILAAARQAQTVLPMRRRLSGAVSRAGAWAMRPQTAMAAVFLLMVGSSVLLVRGRSARSPESQAMKVTEQGAPAATAAAPDESDSYDTKAAALAHGTQEMPKPSAPMPSAAASPSALEQLALSDPNDDARSGTAGARMDVPPPSQAAKDFERKADRPYAAKGEAQNGIGSGWAGSAPTSNLAPPSAARVAPKSAGGMYAEAPASPAAAPLAGPTGGGAGKAAAASADEGSSKRGRSAGGDFESGMAAYRARNFDDATTTFDGIAAGGDMMAALWAARSVREGHGCGAAVARFDQISFGAFATVAGQDATWDAGQCYKNLGSVDTARARFSRLLTVPSYMSRAQAQLDSLAPRAQSKAAAKPAAPPPAKGDSVKQKASF